jgi:carbonic anhydrase
VPVELIFDAGVMDIFVIRTAGNLCGANEIGSIEYGLAHVKTPVFVMLGHTQCGAVTAATHVAEGMGHPLERNIQPLVEQILPAVKKAKENRPDMQGESIVPLATEENMWRGIERLLRESPTVRGLVKQGKTKVLAAVYDVGTGKVHWLPERRVDAILEKVEASASEATEGSANHAEGSREP